MFQHVRVRIEIFVKNVSMSNFRQEDMEDLRERMRVETGLIVVGSADDKLRVNKKKKKTEGITQSVVDRCVAVNYRVEVKFS
jgi:regulatory NSL complex subunit 3